MPSLEKFYAVEEEEGEERVGDVMGEYTPKRSVQRSKSTHLEYRKTVCEMNDALRRFLQDMKQSTDGDDLVCFRRRCDP